MLLPMLLIFEIVVLCTSSILGYPVYGTKRYGRSPTYRTSTPTWMPMQTMQRTQRYPLNYYEFYPYSQSYPEDYYYAQDTYPLYYPRTSKYEVYQAVLPYYYQDTAYTDPKYSYYDYDRDAEVQDELFQEAERREREDAQPIGHEMLYENEGTDEENIDEVKAAFLQNLIMSQMYKDALDKYYEQYPYTEHQTLNNYAAWRDQQEEQLPEYDEEDEDVKELKQLAKPHSRYSSDDRMDNHWFQKSSFRDQKNDNKKKYDQYLSRNNKRSVEGREHGGQPKKNIKTIERRPVIKLAQTTSAPETTTEVRSKVEGKSGQKEEVMMRPATNVRQMFSSPVIEMMKDEFDKKRSTPSVYDKLKYMLDVEKSLENQYGDPQVRPAMKKRLFSSEESLTEQLSLLKKKE